MAGLTRRERERERHLQEVLEAAEAVFAEKGFYEATVQEIANRAEFAVGSIYNMFEGKTALYSALVEMRARQYVEQVKASIEGLSDAVAKVRAVILVKLDFFEKNRRFFSIFVGATGAGSREPPLAISPKGRQIYRSYLEMVGHIFEQGIREGVFRDIDPRVMAVAVEGITNAIIAHSIHTGGERLFGVTPELVEGILFQGILTQGRAS